MLIDLYLAQDFLRCLNPLLPVVFVTEVIHELLIEDVVHAIWDRLWRCLEIRFSLSTECPPDLVNPLEVLGHGVCGLASWLFADWSRGWIWFRLFLAYYYWLFLVTVLFVRKRFLFLRLIFENRCWEFRWLGLIFLFQLLEFVADNVINILF